MVRSQSTRNSKKEAVVPKAAATKQIKKPTKTRNKANTTRNSSQPSKKDQSDLLKPAENGDAVFVFGQNSRIALVPILTKDQTKQYHLHNWKDADKNIPSYIQAVVLYAVTIKGSLQYDKDTFAREYHPVFFMIPSEVFGSLLLNVFGECEAFVRHYQENMSDLNFYTVSMYFRSQRREIGKNCFKHFQTKSSKQNIGFHATSETKQTMRKHLKTQVDLYQNKVQETTKAHVSYFKSLHEEIAGLVDSEKRKSMFTFTEWKKFIGLGKLTQKDLAHLHANEREERVSFSKQAEGEQFQSLQRVWLDRQSQVVTQTTKPQVVQTKRKPPIRRKPYVAKKKKTPTKKAAEQRDGRKSVAPPQLPQNPICLENPNDSFFMREDDTVMQEEPAEYKFPKASGENFFDILRTEEEDKKQKEMYDRVRGGQVDRENSDELAAKFSMNVLKFTQMKCMSKQRANQSSGPQE